MVGWLLVLLLSQVPAPVTLTAIARGESSEISERREVLVRSGADWEALWKAHGAPEAVPVVNFATESVAAVFLGARPTGGFRVDITRARRDGDTLVVEYVERRPGPGDIVAQIVTSPFHIVKVPRHDGPVRFERQAAATGGR